MLHSVAQLGALGVVPLVDGADEIAGYAADALEFAVAVILGASAVRAAVADEAGIAADRVAVDRMVDRAVADAGVLHVADDVLESLEVVLRVAVELDIGDMAAVCQGVIRSLLLYLLVGRDREVDRDMEGVGVVGAVGDAGDGAVLLAVDADEAAGKSLGGRGDEREVHAVLLRRLVGALAHEADYFETEVLGIVGLAVMLADERLEALGETYEADGESAVL